MDFGELANAQPWQRAPRTPAPPWRTAPTQPTASEQATIAAHAGNPGGLPLSPMPLTPAAPPRASTYATDPTPPSTFGYLADVLGGGIKDTLTAPLPRVQYDEGGRPYYQGAPVEPQALSLADRAAALGDYAGFALGGRGGVGPPGRYPLNSQGMDLAKQGGQVTGSVRLGGMAKPARINSPQSIDVPEMTGGVPWQQQTENLMRELQPFIEEFARTAPEGSSIKAIADDVAFRTLGKATPNEASNRLLNRFLDWLIGSEMEGRISDRDRARPQTPELAGRKRPPYSRDPKTGKTTHYIMESAEDRARSPRP